MFTPVTKLFKRNKTAANATQNSTTATPQQTNAIAEVILVPPHKMTCGEWQYKIVLNDYLEEQDSSETVYAVVPNHIILSAQHLQDLIKNGSLFRDDQFLQKELTQEDKTQLQQALAKENYCVPNHIMRLVERDIKAIVPIENNTVTDCVEYRYYDIYYVPTAAETLKGSLTRMGVSHNPKEADPEFSSKFPAYRVVAYQLEKALTSEALTSNSHTLKPLDIALLHQAVQRRQELIQNKSSVINGAKLYLLFDNAMNMQNFKTQIRKAALEPQIQGEILNPVKWPEATAANWHVVRVPDNPEVIETIAKISPSLREAFQNKTTDPTIPANLNAAPEDHGTLLSLDKQNYQRP